MTPTPETIARGLTKAQREAVLGGMQEYAAPNTISALRRKGILWPHLLRLTPLGLAVRAILEREAHD